MRKIIYLSLLCILSLHANSQLNNPKVSDWLNAHAVDLNSNYLKDLSKNLKGNQIVGIAEASHGTEEFFRERNKIVQYLIEKENYTILGLEFPEAYIKPVNDYVLTGEGDLKALMQDFRLYQTKTFFDLIEWIKHYNRGLKQHKIEIFGFDNAAYTNPFTRDSLMAVNTINKQMESQAKLIFCGHNVHLAKSAGEGYKPYGYFIDEKYKQGYYNIAFDTYEGRVNTLSFSDGAIKLNQNVLQPPANNFTALFSKLKYQNFYIHFNANNPLAEINSTITNIYADWRKPFDLRTRFNADFDALIFIKKTKAAIMLE